MQAARLVTASNPARCTRPAAKTSSAVAELENGTAHLLHGSPHERTGGSGPAASFGAAGTRPGGGARDTQRALPTPPVRNIRLSRPVRCEVDANPLLLFEQFGEERELVLELTHRCPRVPEPPVEAALFLAERRGGPPPRGASSASVRLPPMPSTPPVRRPLTGALGTPLSLGRSADRAGRADEVAVEPLHP